MPSIKKSGSDVTESKTAGSSDRLIKGIWGAESLILELKTLAHQGRKKPYNFGIPWGAFRQEKEKAERKAKQ